MKTRRKKREAPMVRRFQQTEDRIIILKGTEQFSCSLQKFQALEPGYPGLPSDMRGRIWTPDLQAMSDGKSQRADSLDCSAYIDKILLYQRQFQAGQWIASEAPDLLEPEYLDTLFQEDELQ